MTNRIVYLAGAGTERSQGQGASKEREGEERDAQGGYAGKHQACLWESQKRWVRRKKGMRREEKKKLEGAAVFGWCMGAAVREDRSPRGSEAGEGVSGVQERRGYAAELGHAGCLSQQGRDAWSRALQGQQVKQHIQDPRAAELGGKERAAARCRLRCSEEWQQTAQHRDVTQVSGRAGRELLCRQGTDHSCLGKGLA